jgi:ABC-2 type transport system permease protein
MTALVVLTERIVLASIRDLDLLLAVLVPAGSFVALNLGLRNVIDTGGMSYSQYVLPVVVVQAMLFSALTTADRANRDHWSELGDRFHTFPIPSVAPLMARMLYCLISGVVALAAAISTAFIFDFRMAGGSAYTMGFVILALMLTLALSLGADAIGTRVKRSEASSQLLLVPQLLLVLLSTGMAPADSFPDWLHPFVQYQPVSQVTETLRGFATGHVVGANLATSLAWCLGLLILFGTIAVRMERRRQ